MTFRIRLSGALGALLLLALLMSGGARATPFYACPNALYFRGFTGTGGLDGSFSQTSDNQNQPGWGAFQVARRNVCAETGGVWNQARNACGGRDAHTECVDLVKHSYRANCRRHQVGDGVRTGTQLCTNANSLDSAGGSLDANAGEIFNSIAFTDYPTYLDWILDNQAQGLDAVSGNVTWLDKVSPGAQNAYDTTKWSGVAQLNQYMLYGEGASNADRQNTVYLPIAAGTDQSFLIADIDLSKLTLAEVCETPSRWRYLPPSQFLWENACEELFLGGQLSGNVTLEFIVAGEGASGVLMRRLQQGYDIGSPGLSGLEFASGEDNCPTCVDPNSAVYRFGAPLSRDPLGNAGHNGAVNYHYPADHQPGFLLWGFIANDCSAGKGDFSGVGTVIDDDGTTVYPQEKIQRLGGRNACWQDLVAKDLDQAVLRGLYASVRESYDKSLSIQCRLLQDIDTRNRGQHQLNVVPVPAANGIPGLYKECSLNNNEETGHNTADVTKACLHVDPVNPYVDCDGNPVSSVVNACSADFVVRITSDDIRTGLHAQHLKRIASTSTLKQKSICRGAAGCQDILNSFYAYEAIGGAPPKPIPVHKKFPATCRALQYNGLVPNAQGDLDWDANDSDVDDDLL